jgi:hypothetical protein
MKSILDYIVPSAFTSFILIQNKNKPLKENNQDYATVTLGNIITDPEDNTAIPLDEHLVYCARGVDKA